MVRTSRGAGGLLKNSKLNRNEVEIGRLSDQLIPERSEDRSLERSTDTGAKEEAHV